MITDSHMIYRNMTVIFQFNRSMTTNTHHAYHASRPSMTTSPWPCPRSQYVPSHHPPHPRQVEHCHRWTPRDPHHGISSRRWTGGNWGCTKQKYYSSFKNQKTSPLMVFHTIASELLRIMTCDDHSHGSYSTPFSVLDLRLISETALAG